MMNKNNIRSECPWRSCAETWDHVIKYKATMKIRKTFVNELKSELQKAKLHNVDSEEILSFAKYILRYFDDDDSEEFETNQELIRI